MSDCKQFEVALKYTNDGEHGSRDGHAKITHSFKDSSKDDGVIFTIQDSAMNASIHTTAQSLVAMANKLIKELTP
jgi:hypothetical protein